MGTREARLGFKTAAMEGWVQPTVFNPLSMPWPKPGTTTHPLFPAGTQGGWWDPSDLSTLWQDAAGTVPVTADGDPVGRIDDKSGNGNHLLQIGTDVTRLMYKTDGTLHWVQGDGLGTGFGDYLRALFTITQPWERISAIRQLSWTSGDFVFGGGTANTGILQQVGTTPGLRAYSGTFLPLTDSPAIAADAVITERHSTTGRVAVNNEDYDTGSTGATLPGGVTLFASQAGTGAGNLRCYGFVMRSGLMPDHTILAVRRFLAGKSGVTL